MGGGSGDTGYECVESIATVFDDNVITGSSPYSYAMGNIDYHELLPQSITVTFEGTAYELERSEYGFYGGADHSFSEYPFEIENHESNGTVYTNLYTPSVGTYSLKIEAVERSIIITPCFEAAVNASVSQGGGSVDSPLFLVEFLNQSDTVEATVTYNEVKNARLAGKILVGCYNRGYAMLSGIVETYGIMNFQFDFIKFDYSFSKVFCDSILYKYDGTIERTRKEIATVNA